MNVGMGWSMYRDDVLLNRFVVRCSCIMIYFLIDLLFAISGCSLFAASCFPYF